MSEGAGEAAHPLLRALATVRAALDEVGDLDPVFVPTAQKRELLLGLSRESERLHGLLLAVVGNAGDVAGADGADGARNVASWLTARTRTSHGANHATEQLAGSLESSWRRVQAGLRAGEVTGAQARVLVTALDRLADARVAPDLLAKAEAHLVEQAGLFDPRGLRRLGRRVLEVIAPEAYDDDERRRFEEDERRAGAATSLVVTHRSDGATDLRLRLPYAAASRLLGFLDAFTAPRRAALVPNVGASVGAGVGSGWEPGRTDEATGQRVPTPRLRGKAFCALLEHLDPDRLPAHGGQATTLVITVDLATLVDGTGIAEHLHDGQTITAGQARRLACTAGLIPAVLGTASAPLDLGRSTRLFNPAQRTALALRDRHCRADGCTMPARWCEAHHAARPWSRGGRTDLADGKLLCPWHHHRAHDDAFLHKELPNGDLRFHRRTWGSPQKALDGLSARRCTVKLFEQMFEQLAPVGG